MKLQVIGCSHHNSSIEKRERLAFSPQQTHEALSQFRRQYPETEAVLLSTCNRVELYTAAENSAGAPSHHDVVHFLADFHQLNPAELFDDLFERTGEDAIRHLFTVAASLDSMVVGESQILSQVKQAYDLATGDNCTGPLTHTAFQSAIRVAKRVANETAVNEKRVSIPSIAVADFASQIFERFDDKRVLVIGAGEMGQETLRYLIDEGARDIIIINRSIEKSQQVAQQIAGRAEPWDRLQQLLVEADLVVSATGATQPIFTLDNYRQIEHDRYQRPLFILDLAVPRDFDPGIGDCIGVFLYSVDDLHQACENNRRLREKEWPKAELIIEEETARFIADFHHRATGPTIRRLKKQADQIKNEELSRLLNKIDLDDRSLEEVQRSFDRFVNKLLHPPLESLRDEAQQGAPHGLLEALKRLFQLSD